ncbi:ancient vomeronasal 1 receptor [Xenopus tropicalis]|uniref:Ancient vomeronasal 1 receptor n=1 Tax=Xenopus tropicalis TaxID=8364 RepID=A0A8J0QFP8_XENTR|nr:ancient vomeronasal 1 receptor [Xenopus tropicalis]
MKLPANSVRIIACSILIFVSFLGNTILIYCTWRCIERRLPTSFALIFSLSVVHLVKNLVVNTINISYSAGIPSTTLSCKIGIFTGSVGTTLEIWFTLYLAIFYCFKLNRVVYPRRAPPNGKWRKFHLMTVFALWITAIALSCPYLIFGDNVENEAPLNISYFFHHNFLNEECGILFRDDNVKLYYQQIFMVIIDLLPLAILVMLSFRIVLLLYERKNATYGNFWLRHDASETEVLRASKLVILLMSLVTALWISHFILVYFLKYITSWSFSPTVVAVLFSGYSSLSPYLLMLINYKISLKLRSLSSFCCTNTKKSKSSDAEKSLPKNAIVEN